MNGRAVLGRMRSDTFQMAPSKNQTFIWKSGCYGQTLICMLLPDLQWHRLENHIGANKHTIPEKGISQRSRFGLKDTGRLSEIIPVIGYGPIGREVAGFLLEYVYHVRMIQPKQPDNLRAGASFYAADTMGPDQLIKGINSLDKSPRW